MKPKTYLKDPESSLKDPEPYIKDEDQKTAIRGNLYYANFDGVNLSNASLWQAELLGATFVDAVFDHPDLTQANAEGVDFSKATGLADENIYGLSLRSLYRIKFNLQDPNDPCELRFRIGFTYAKKLAVLHNLDQNKVQTLLTQIELSGFSPFRWAFEEERFNQQFEALKSAAPIDDAALLQVIKDKIGRIVPENNLPSGSYYQNRLNTEGPDSWKSIFAKTPRESRNQQIVELQKIGESTKFSNAIESLIKIKIQIELEWNIWDSELLKQINALIREVNLQATASTSSTSIQLTQSN